MTEGWMAQFILQVPPYCAMPRPIKADQARPQQTPADRREQLLEEFERSGLSGSKFAQLVGIKYQTFAPPQQNLWVNSGSGSRPSV